MAGLNFRDGMRGDEKNAFPAWTKALFDPSSEGIEDTILRYVLDAPSFHLCGSQATELPVQRPY